MSRSTKLILSFGVVAGLSALQSRQAVRGWRRAARTWRSEPVRMSARLGASAMLGQAIFWRFGYDQIGLFMDPRIVKGSGTAIAARINARLPQTAQIAWTIKVLEVATDYLKCPAEGALYARTGVVPDVVAALVTQPAWSAIETAEKAVGAILHPERVTTPEQVEVSIACIYGSLFRIVEALILIRLSEPLNRLLDQVPARTGSATG